MILFIATIFLDILNVSSILVGFFHNFCQQYLYSGGRRLLKISVNCVSSEIILSFSVSKIYYYYLGFLYLWQIVLLYFKTLCCYNLGHMLVGICEIWQKVLVRELAGSAYFRSASSESDNKWFSVEGLGTRLPHDTLTCLRPMTIWPKILSLKSTWKIYRFMNYIYKASSNSACGVKYRRNCKKSTDYMSKIVVTAWPATVLKWRADIYMQFCFHN